MHNQQSMEPLECIDRVAIKALKTFFLNPLLKMSNVVSHAKL